MATITKKELVDRICEATGLSRIKVKESLQLFLDHIIAELGKGNRLEFREFGVFEIKTRAARTAQNPKTLQPVPVPAKRTVKFKVGRKMREKLAEMHAGNRDEPLATIGNGVVHQMPRRPDKPAA